jgi:glycogen debranching enzyme
LDRGIDPRDFRTLWMGLVGMTREGRRVLVGSGTMLNSDTCGNIRPGLPGPSGLFRGDTRLLSQWVLSTPGRDLEIGSAAASSREGTTVLVPAAGRNQTTDVILTRRQRMTVSGLDETVVIRNTSGRAVSVKLELECATDFADQFTLRSDNRVFDRSGAIVSVSAVGEAVNFNYRRGLGGRSFEANLIVRVSGSPALSRGEYADSSTVGGTFSWDIELAPGGSRTLELTAHVPGTRAEVATLSRSAGKPDRLRDRGLDDIAALRMPSPLDEGFTVLGAGVPWFLTLFGRDSLIASMLVEPDMPGLLDGTLRALAATQSSGTDISRLATEGKIVHELRTSELAALGEIPYGRYYGSVDSTPLFLSGIAASGSRKLAVDLELPARAAVAWMLSYGGLAKHGFLRYLPDPNGLLHQGWKDSFDAIAHSDGALAEGAIALCEVQGYAWRALIDTARLARLVWNDPGWAESLLVTASELKTRFRTEFWMPEQDFPALAIDGDGRPVEVIASNAGHLLFSGILDPPEAARVTERLMQPDMFTGWGLRTLSSAEVRYHPLAYHNGAVWPHDTMLAALGMSAYGLQDHSRRLAAGISAAAASFDDRLPELFGGFPRSEFELPVACAHAARPQAWAAAAGVAATRLLRAATV